MAQALHGGSDSGPPIRHDFSSNASPLGPPPALLDALLGADRGRYPDPQYLALREALAAAHGVTAERVLPTAGGSEAIRRLSLAARLAGLREVWVPRPGFGDYAAAAQALGLQVSGYASVAELTAGLQGAALVWVCEPCNPTGASLDAHEWTQLGAALRASGAHLAIDQAYEPLRLQGQSSLPPALAERAWRLQCPNKALGLTGVRAGYLLAPAEAPWLQAMQDLAPSWVLSSEGCALLGCWHSPATQAHLQRMRAQVLDWRAAQRELLADLGWQQRASCCNFWLACPPAPLPDLRPLGIKLRDAASLGLPGWLRVSTQDPAAQHALHLALRLALKDFI
ncbi:aminotransferase class I/II-fold pyridoxal phosphate-dependent enzyme [Paucibacter soli]|uniref:aminotransferase class I/II-fold pyridoxal phosphate-dependent enzyme n=1 Tax=Paucibacter soli TaxID=3133433 RepID=UPI0030A9A048